MNDEAAITIAKYHIHRSYQHGQYYPLWTFQAPAYFRIGFNILEFDCYTMSSSSCYVKIGDGLVSGQSRRLYLCQQQVATSVTSSNNTAWMRARYDRTA